MSNRIDKDGNKKAKKLKVAGFIILPIGVLLFVTSLFGFASFDAELFLLSFVGLPMIAFGGSLLMLGYQGSIQRYHASQSAPVLKDTLNYLQDETNIKINDSKQCKDCGNMNDKDATFCDKCGSSLVKICDDCNCSNDGDASFCKHCGKKL